jgi:uncharacterized protein YecE (DUF72 family)
MSLNHVGTAGWSIPKQHASDFPDVGTHLARYSRIFSCAEINSSFYRPHRLSTWAGWAASTPDNFRFSVKAPKAITHEARLVCSPKLLRDFFTQVNTLANKLGPILFQLPPKFAFNSTVTKAFFTLLRDQYTGPAILEPRNASWFTPEANELLWSFQIARAAADPARIPEAASAGGWNQVIYCRLHGSPRMYYSAYPHVYLQALAKTIANHPAKDIWCIFDNTASGAALGDALILKNFLNP